MNHSDYADMPRRNILKSHHSYIARGITLLSALCVLCRHRHKTHWTGSSNRLARDFGKRFGDNRYAMEELVAELGAAFLCSELGITQEPREDHACYINNWLQVLKQDSKAIITAASQASKASDFLLAKFKENQFEEAG